MICEKPDAAARIAKVIDEDGVPRKQEMQGVPYFECSTKDGIVVVCSALGHLYSVSSKKESPRRSYPVWDISWKPKHQISRKFTYLARWVRAIGSLAEKADEFVNSCDYDAEGSLIGQTILQYACNGADSRAKRMRFSTLTERELRAAYRNLSNSLDFPLIEAGRCRHELDWLYGINLSRVMTEAVVKARKGYATLSTGRVQGPTLNFVVEREEEVVSFVPIPFWKIEATVEHQGKKYEPEYYKDKIPTLSYASRIVSECKDSLLDVRGLDAHEFQQTPPYPFDLSTLQAEAFRQFGYSPAETLASAERLYLDALVSYPRTSSQKLPVDIGYDEILQELSSGRYRNEASKLLTLDRLRPVQGPKEDPAHPAIYPTGQKGHPLRGPETRIYDLIVRRFMATFAEPSLKQSLRMILAFSDHEFFLGGSRILRKGWTEFYFPYVVDDAQELPDFAAGQQVRLRSIRALERFTQPPPRYNPGSLLRRMEEEQIGTKATRAEIIEILGRRGYVRGVRMRPTPVATEVVLFLSRYCPEIIDAGLTAKIEEQMGRIQQHKVSRKQVVVEALEDLRRVLKLLEDKEVELGRKLAEVVSAQRTASITFESPCPTCGSALRIVRNKRTRKRFIGCTGKWDKGCKFALPLPQFGTISIASRHCKDCGFQLVRVRSKGSRRLLSCPRCYVSKPRVERHRQRSEAALEEKPMEVEHPT